MLTRLIRLSVATLALGGVLTMNASANEQEWRALFNGKNLDGWQHVGPGRFVIENGLSVFFGLLSRRPLEAVGRRGARVERKTEGR